MARYRIQFSREWIRGRWGFINRMFEQLGGRVTEPSRTENAWFLEFRGDAEKLGQFVSDKLEIKGDDFRQFGSIFEIEQVNRPTPKRSEPDTIGTRARHAHAKKLGAPLP